MDGDAIRTAAAVAGATGVSLGAFGAHALKSVLEKTGRTAVYQTGVQYHLLHAVALLALSAAARKDEHSMTAKLWSGGIVLFSGSLYGLAVGGPRLLGPVTPIGGMCFIAGWAALAMAKKKEDD
eukprot:gnl/TRDRNA2_/TRDRNA2_27765_c0_seq1.p1 gnl/TRDRNA2_/TRDRNA2_27765_c0~~gnl/TRDRNA2_/TRDRNA2_27765_c0_seq1.p1  ORF type:complete len:143 (+),score=24.08 gnl/TRDRNA2_/TRDRNA2_27765_c0_seq1:58-429(+)